MATYTDVSAGTLAGRMPRRVTVAEATAARTCDSDDFGKTIFLSYEGAVAVTLPANGAPPGAQIDFIVTGSDSCAPTFTAASANTLIAFNDATATSVAPATGYRVASHFRFISNGTYWVATALSGNNATAVTVV